MKLLKRSKLERKYIYIDYVFHPILVAYWFLIIGHTFVQEGAIVECVPY